MATFTLRLTVGRNRDMMKEKQEAAMERKRIQPDLTGIPGSILPFAENTVIFDSSCSSAARVWYLDREEGFYLKRAARGTLGQEAGMTAFFREKGLSARVVAYESGEYDWLLTSRIAGEDCLHRRYLEDPERLCDTLGSVLRLLHGQAAAGCPVSHSPEEMLRRAACARDAGKFNRELAEEQGFSSPEEAWQAAVSGAALLKTDTLIHGDYCLPNVMLDNWHFSGLIDVGGGGIGDRHVDLFWGIWSLGYNLKTTAYTQRFLDAYGREAVDPEALRTVAAMECFG